MFKADVTEINSMAQADMSAATNAQITKLVERAKKLVGPGESLDFYHGFISALHIVCEESVASGAPLETKFFFTALTALAAEEFRQLNSSS